MTTKIKELEDAINRRLEKFDGRKFNSTTSGSSPEYHRWYAEEIEAELKERGINIFVPRVWKIVAEIDGPGEVKVSYKPIADVEVNAKRDRRYKFGGPGVIQTIRVHFEEELLGLTIEEARVHLLKADLASRIAYYRAERSRLSREMDVVADKIATLIGTTIEETTV